jgi:hypothetical protein
MGVASVYAKKSQVCTMKKIILSVIAQFVVLGGLMASNFVSGDLTIMVGPVGH